MRFDIIHQLNPVFTGLSLGLIGTRTPIVLGTYVGEWPDPRQRRDRLAQRCLAALQQYYAAALLLTTPAAAGRIITPKRVVRKTFLLPNGIDTQHFSPAPDHHSRGSIVALCGLSPHKGAWLLLDAFRLVHQSFPAAELTIAGGVADREIWVARERLGPAADRVSFSGPVSRDELPALMRAHTIFCMPSYGEPYGMAAVEAMACGLPIVATNSGGLAYLVDERGGRKFPEGSRDALVSALSELLRDGDVRRRCGEYNRTLALQRHAWPVVIERLETIYRGLLTEPLQYPNGANPA